jgi:hypothetical protein
VTETTDAITKMMNKTIKANPNFNQVSCIERGTHEGINNVFQKTIMKPKIATSVKLLDNG